MPSCPSNLKKILSAPWNNGLPGAFLALCIFLPLLIAVYSPLCMDSTVLLGRGDLWGEFAPTAFYLDHAISQGDWPQWNPLVFCGVPFAANPQSAAYYPPNLFRALLNTSPTPLSTFQSIAWMQLLHLLALGLGLYLLCRRLGLSWLAAVSAACAVILSSSMAYRAVQHWTFIALAAHFPWQMLALHSLMRAQETIPKLRCSIVFGILMASAVLTGCPQILVYPVFCLAAFALLLRMGPIRPANTWKAWRNIFAIDVLMAGIALLVTLGLSAALLLPAAELASYCARAKTGISNETMANAVLVPQIHIPSTVFAAFIQYPGENSLRFLGLIGAMLAFCVFFYKRSWPLFSFAILFAVMFDMALGPPMPIASLVSWLTPLYLSEPERAMLIGIAVLGVLLGMGIDSVLRPKSGTLSPLSRACLVALIGTCSALTLFKTLREDSTTQWWMWGLPALAVASLTLAQLPRLAKFGAYTAVCLLLSHMFFSARDYLHTLAYSNPYPGDCAALDNTAQWPLENTRNIAGKSLENTGMYRLNAAVNGYDPLIPETLNTLLHAENFNVIYNTRIFAEDVTQENTLGHNLLKRRFQLAKGYSTEPFPSRSDVNFLPSHVVFLSEEAQPTLAKNRIEENSWIDALEPLQVQPAIRREGNDNFIVEPIQDDPRHRFVEVQLQNNSPEKAQISTAILTQNQNISSLKWILAPGEKKLKRIPLPDWEDMHLRLSVSPSSATDSLEIISVKSLVDALDTPENIEITKTAPDSVTVQIQNTNDAEWLLFTEYTYPGWKAYLDGVQTPIYSADAAFQAVEIPPGTHEVHFEFSSSTVRLGLQISLTALTLTAIALMLLLRIGPKGSYRI